MLVAEEEHKRRESDSGKGTPKDKDAEEKGHGFLKLFRALDPEIATILIP